MYVAGTNFIVRGLGVRKGGFIIIAIDPGLPTLIILVLPVLLCTCIFICINCFFFNKMNLGGKETLQSILSGKSVTIALRKYLQKINAIEIKQCY